MELTIQPQRLAETFAALVSIDSPSYGEREMADTLIRRLEVLGAAVEEDDAAAKIGGNCGNLYGFLPGSLELPPILLSAHMDTVAPAHGKRAIQEPDGRIHSAGDTVLGSDDLAAIAAILEVLTALQESGLPHRPVELLFSVAEEAYCVGASAFDYQKLKSREAYVLDCEGSLGEAVVAAPTILEFTACVQGRSSHAGFAPEAGISAINAAAQAILSVKSGRVAADTTLNFGLIEGGLATNIVPDRCTVRGEIRSSVHARAQEQAALVQQAFAAACREYGAKLEFSEKCFLQAYRLPETAPVVQRYFQVCQARGYDVRTVTSFGGSDNNLLAAHGIDGIVVPSAMHLCHSCQEYTSVQELAALAEIVADLVLSQEGD